MCDNLNVENKRTFEKKKKKDNRTKNGKLDILGDVKKPKQTMTLMMKRNS